MTYLPPLTLNYLTDGWRGRIRRKGADMLEAFLGRVFIWMTNQRWAQRHPWFNPAKSDTRWLPINTDIEMPDNCFLFAITLKLDVIFPAS